MKSCRDNICMKQIGVEEVINKAEELLCAEKAS